jgi:hypothetical protein
VLSREETNGATLIAVAVDVANPAAMRVMSPRSARGTVDLRVQGLPPKCWFAALASVRSPITDSGRMAVSGHSFMATGGQNPMSADTTLSPSDMDLQQFDLRATAPATFARQDTPWAEIEPRAGEAIQWALASAEPPTGDVAEALKDLLALDLLHSHNTTERKAEIIASNKRVRGVVEWLNQPGADRRGRRCTDSTCLG